MDSQKAGVNLFHSLISVLPRFRDFLYVCLRVCLSHTHHLVTHGHNLCLQGFTKSRTRSDLLLLTTQTQVRHLYTSSPEWPKIGIADKGLGSEGSEKRRAGLPSLNTTQHFPAKQTLTCLTSPWQRHTRSRRTVNLGNQSGSQHGHLRMLFFFTNNFSHFS